MPCLPQKLVLPLAILSVIFSCNTEEKHCDTAFLDKVDAQQVFYNENNLVAQLSWGVVTKFTYTETNQVSTVTGFSSDNEPTDQVKFFYDETDRMDYALRFHNSLLVDSIQPTYDDQDRIIKLTYHVTDLEPDPAYTLYQTIEYGYTGTSSTQSIITRSGGYEQINTFEFDNKFNPFPAEARLLNFLYTPFYFSDHNAIRITYEIDGGGNYSGD
jgi:hypothetical protein